MWLALATKRSYPWSLDDALLERRMRGGPMFEKEGTQRIIMMFLPLGFIALLVVPALDHRFGWVGGSRRGRRAGRRSRGDRLLFHFPRLS
jgi:hypothetical protein